MLTDTAPEVEAVLLQLLRQAPVWRKLQLMTQLNDMARTLALGSLRSQYPQATETELQRLLADRLLGVEMATKVYGLRSNLEESSRAV
jgi:hypothetical protein